MYNTAFLYKSSHFTVAVRTGKSWVAVFQSWLWGISLGLMAASDLSCTNSDTLQIIWCEYLLETHLTSACNDYQQMFCREMKI